MSVSIQFRSNVWISTYLPDGKLMTQTPDYPYKAMGQSPLFIKATAKWMTASPVLVVMLVTEELQNFTLITSEMNSIGRKI